MKSTITVKVIVLIIVVFVFFIVIYKKNNLKINVIDKNKIESFDLILTKGQSIQSKLISILNFSTNDFTHIGILVEEDVELFVLHSTPDGTKMNGIRYDDLQTFIDMSNVSDCEILRHQCISDNSRLELIKWIDYYKSIERPFDFVFDNLSAEKIYCSELVWLIFKNTELMENNFFDLTKPIYPKYFKNMNKLVSVNFKKIST